MPAIQVEISRRLPTELQAVEIVERKGKGHPDTICDNIAEAISIALCREYVERTGRILHFNADKMMLVAGQSIPAFGGGRVTMPMRLIIGDRATTHCDGKSIPVWEIAEATAKDWCRKNLRYINPDDQIIFQNELRAGSSELTGILDRQQVVANDTSAGAGSGPRTETEQLVIAAEQFLTSASVQLQFPWVGEDIKVMGVRRNRCLTLTVAIAFVDRFIRNQSSYYILKEQLRHEVTEHLRPSLGSLDQLVVEINTLDEPSLGNRGCYLTVTGTSAEGADGGEVGRGNRVNGVISLNRPMSMEAAAGKNPLTHVGKIYNVLALEIAQRLACHLKGVREANVWICSQIGRPIDEPCAVSVELLPEQFESSQHLIEPTRAIVLQQLEHVQSIVNRLIRGEVKVC